MPHCRDCRHFEEPNPADSRHPEFGQCELAYSTDGEPEHKETIAIAVNGDSWIGILYVKPEFGCVQFERAD